MLNNIVPPVKPVVSTNPTEPVIPNSGESTSTTPVDSVTKIVSDRIKAAREKDRVELAKALGFDSWDTALNSSASKKMLDAGIDPALGKPVIDDLVNNHPDVIKARNILAESANESRQASLAALNTKYGLNLTYDSLDANVKKLIETGVPVDVAYMAYHYNEVTPQGMTLDVKTINQQQKGSTVHMTSIPGNSAPPLAEVNVTPEELAGLQRMIPNATIEQVKEFKKKYSL